MPKFRRISSHAIEQYCLRMHSNVAYYVSHPEILREMQERASKAMPSRYNPKDFFNGCRGIKSDNISLFQDSSLIYAIRDNEIITVIPVPGANKLNDMFRKAILKRE